MKGGISVIYCPICNVGVDDSDYRNTIYCPVCGRILKWGYSDPRAQAEAERKEEEERRRLAQNNAYFDNYTSGGSYSGGGGYSSKKNLSSIIGTIVSTVALAAIAYYFFGETAAGIIVAIGIAYLLRHVIKVLVVIGAGVLGYFVCDGMGFNGLIGALIAAFLAYIIAGKIIEFFE